MTKKQDFVGRTWGKWLSEQKPSTVPPKTSLILFLKSNSCKRHHDTGILLSYYLVQKSTHACTVDPFQKNVHSTIRYDLINHINIDSGLWYCSRLRSSFDLSSFLVFMNSTLSQCSGNDKFICQHLVILKKKGKKSCLSSFCPLEKP